MLGLLCPRKQSFGDIYFFSLSILKKPLPRSKCIQRPKCAIPYYIFSPRRENEGNSTQLDLKSSVGDQEHSKPKLNVYFMQIPAAR